MTFEEWWMTLLPAEVDELKPVFESCWIEAWTGGAKEEREACAQICDENFMWSKDLAASSCAREIRKRSNAAVRPRDEGGSSLEGTVIHGDETCK